ncbi:hypothetical protein JK159_02385 [Weissella minor]|uniref:hypothetical protein n=1 Tax=Weissella minor TaxID=1620 RepID=UPI001BAEE89E|nr:hypothetical protein [Weissella minor]MBS0949231.1 hypothetical protein [Weissella minor]
MGQRLVITFTDGDHTFVTLYQHWSGYTQNALETLQEISKAGQNIGLFNKNLSPQQKKHLLIKVLASQYFVQPSELAQTKLWDKYLTDEEITENSQRQTFTPHRNTGLVSLSSMNIENAIYWAEMLVEIDLNTFDFDVTDLFWENELQDIDDPFGLSEQDILAQLNELDKSIINLAELDDLKTISTYLENSPYCQIVDAPNTILTSIA